MMSRTEVLSHVPSCSAIPIPAWSQPPVRYQVAVVAKVDPDTTAKWDATGTVNAKGPVNCDLESVKRAAVP